MKEIFKYPSSNIIVGGVGYRYNTLLRPLASSPCSGKGLLCCDHCLSDSHERGIQARQSSTSAALFFLASITPPSPPPPAPLRLSDDGEGALHSSCMLDGELQGWFRWFSCFCAGSPSRQRTTLQILLSVVPSCPVTWQQVSGCKGVLVQSNASPMYRELCPPYLLGHRDLESRVLCTFFVLYMTSRKRLFARQVYTPTFTRLIPLPGPLHATTHSSHSLDALSTDGRLCSRFVLRTRHFTKLAGISTRVLW